MKVLGGILLILGTSIGAGMLALPVASAYENIWLSIGMLATSWLVMTVGAFLLLEVNLWLPEKSNIISMARQTLGVPGQLFAWTVYLLLLYALLCAYIAGGADIVHTLFSSIRVSSPHWLDALLVVLTLGFIVYRGMYSVDIINRGLMSLKFLIYAILVVAIAPHIKLSYLLAPSHDVRLSTLMVMITSFGFAIIVPSLRIYFSSNVKQLSKVVLWGSLLPLVIYTFWIITVQGLIPRVGHLGLLQSAQSGHVTSSLMLGIADFLRIRWVADFANLFISICAITSFLGVSISLVDFLADGLGIDKQTKKGAWVYLFTFLPPLLIVSFWPGIFITALGYGGVLCVLLLILLPVMMAWSGRYIKQIAQGYRFPINRLGLSVIILFSIAVLALLLFQVT